MMDIINVGQVQDHFSISKQYNILHNQRLDVMIIELRLNITILTNVITYIIVFSFYILQRDMCKDIHLSLHWKYILLLILTNLSTQKNFMLNNCKNN